MCGKADADLGGGERGYIVLMKVFAGLAPLKGWKAKRPRGLEHSDAATGL
jgi:hypothetical protein